MTRSPLRRAALTGFSLIELMIAITLGMLVVAGLALAFANASRGRDEMERSSQQIENGRYAMQVLADDLRIAGYLSYLNVDQAGLVTPAAKPDPCATALADLTAAMPLHIQGYDNATAATIAALTCLADVKPGTDIVVVRRASTCRYLDADCATVATAPYFQASLCTDPTKNELGAPSNTNPAPGPNYFKLDSNIANLDRTTKACVAGTLAERRQYLTRIYFVASNGTGTDGVPTLKRAELGAGPGFAIVPIAAGIEDLQLEYGIDTDGDGTPNAINADPDTFGACAGAACVANWRNVVSVRINLLARNTALSPGYTDNKTYTLGQTALLAANTVGPFNNPYKRHVYQSEVRLTNAAGRKE